MEAMVAAMLALLEAIVGAFIAAFRPRTSLVAENLALRQQLAALMREGRPPRLLVSVKRGLASIPGASTEIHREKRRILDVGEKFSPSSPRRDDSDPKSRSLRCTWIGVSNPDLEVLDVEVLGGLTREEAEGVAEGVERGLRGLHGAAVAVTPTDIKPPVKVRLPAVTKADELPIVLTIQEAAGVLRTSVGSIYQMISSAGPVMPFDSQYRRQSSSGDRALQRDQC